MRLFSYLLPLAATFFLFASPASALNIDWVTVGDPGNACDVQSIFCFGAVARTYRMSKTEVTNAQYAEFLNAVAAADPNALYNSSMGSGFGGITRIGSPGSFMYSTNRSRASMPVNYVSIWDSLRFANWLQNGQPTGPQGNATTEDGAYVLTPAGIADNVLTRNLGATIFLPSEDEWYKAAYFNGTRYFDYPAATDTQTACAAPGATANTANCHDGAIGDLTAVGSYTGSASPYGTFDQGGNVFEWNEADANHGMRGQRGGSFDSFGPADLAAAFRWGDLPTSEQARGGFRVASVPEPATGLLLMLGVLGLASWRRRRV